MKERGVGRRKEDQGNGEGWPNPLATGLAQLSLPVALKLLNSPLPSVLSLSSLAGYWSKGVKGPEIFMAGDSAPCLSCHQSPLNCLLRLLHSSLHLIRILLGHFSLPRYLITFLPCRVPVLCHHPSDV